VSKKFSGIGNPIGLQLLHLLDGKVRGGAISSLSRKGALILAAPSPKHIITLDIEQSHVLQNRILFYSISALPALSLL
jgi:hypothetical protein